MLMIRDSPLAGVGFGMYHGLVSGIGRMLNIMLPPDNAQNWLRHQIAELGLIGAAGWIAWCVLFTAALIVPRRSDPGTIWIVRLILLVFGLASLLGMPGQDPMMGLTFWVFAFWYARLRGAPADVRPLAGRTLVAGAVLLAVFAAQSIIVSAGHLRPVERARTEGLHYSYGYGPAATAGALAGFRVVDRRAVTLVAPEAPWMLVTLRLAEQARQLSDVRVAVNERVVLKAQLTPGVPFTGVVDLAGITDTMVLETRATADGRWPLSFDPSSDVLMKWEFAPDVPPRFKVVRRPLEGRQN
jgi:hypothetical protein